MTVPLQSELQLPLRFVRHGATAANLAGLRCGGDLDLPLTGVGQRQAEEVAAFVCRLQPSIGLIVTSDLRRTRDTARIIARALPNVEIVVEPELAERRLGEWNLRPIAETQAWIGARCTPPGGESDADFIDRIARGIRRIRPLLHRHPLLVGSKGVARVMGELVGWPVRLELANGEIAEFELSSQPFLKTTWGSPP